jgi:hypothetical protein
VRNMAEGKLVKTFRDPAKAWDDRLI